MKLKVIVTGVTGMVGEGVLYECLHHPDIEEVLVIARRPCGVTHSKLKEIIHSDFFNLNAIKEQLKGYNACFFCLGVTSIGKNEQEYTKATYTLTLNFAKNIASNSPELTFCYVSGAYTDSSEKGRSMWARVKGKTENDLLKLFKNAYMYRPNYMQPTPGLKNALKFYNYIKWMYPLLRILFKNNVCSLAELGQSMINVALNGYDKKILEVKDIVKSAKNS